MKARDLKTFLFYFLKFVIYTIIIRRRVVVAAFKLHSLYTSVSVCNVTHFNTVKQAKDKMLLLSSNLSSLSPPFFLSRVCFRSKQF